MNNEITKKLNVGKFNKKIVLNNPADMEYLDDAITPGYQRGWVKYVYSTAKQKISLGCS